MSPRAIEAAEQESSQEGRVGVEVGEDDVIEGRAERAGGAGHRGAG